MYQAIFYKEWIKTRKLIALAIVVFLGFIAYTFISTAQMFRISGAVSIWEMVIMKDLPLLSYMKWLPLLAAVLLSLAQYVPEMYNKRLKLTLHLPLPESGILISMLFYGVMVLLLFYIISCMILLTGLRMWFPPEIVWASFYASAPWFLSGVAAYLLTTWICLEPVWKQRIISGLVAICCLSLFFIEAKSGGYHPFIPYLLGFSVLSLFFPFYSVVRFKDGAQ
jgi:hypothetical protein